MRYVLAMVSMVVLAAPAWADDCDKAAAQIVEKVQGSAVEGRNNIGTGLAVINLVHRDISSLSFMCTETISLHAGSPDGLPTRAYMHAVQRIGSVFTNAPEREVARGVQTCIKTALERKSELAETTSSNLYVECQAFRRSGGGAAVTIRRK